MLTLNHPIQSTLLAGVVVGAWLAAAACSDSQAPALGGAQFSTQVGINDFQQRVDSGPARVRMTLADTGLLATRVNIKRPDQLTRPERIEGPITAISVGGADSSMTLELGGLVIGFSGATRFRAEDEGDDDEGEGHDATGAGSDGWGDVGEHRGLTAADFVARVQADLDAGRHPAVTALRQPPASPQAPDDATFIAEELRLDHEADHRRIELNVSADNVELNASPPPDAQLHVLGLSIAVDVTGGITHLEMSTRDTEGEMHFRGLVQSVDQGAGTVLLTDGTVLRIVAGTRFEDDDDFDEADATALASLADVQAALDAGKHVVARGEGVLDTASPPVFDVIEVEFRIAAP